MLIRASLFLLPLTLACASSDHTSTTGTCTGVELIVAASDYRSSVICGAPGCTENPRTSGTDLGGDPQLAVSNGRAFFLARENDTLFEVDPTCGTPTGRFSVHELATKDPTTGGVRVANPHDAAAAKDGTVIVPLYLAAKLAFVRDGRVETAIDLAPYDEDGNPQAEAIRVVDVAGVSKAFVTLERLDDDKGLISTRPSSMLRIDVATRTVEATIPLAGRNPFNPMVEHNGGLFLSEPGNFIDAAEELAGIERFDTQTSTTRMLVGERDIGGSVAEVAVTEGCGAAIVAGPEKDVNPTSVITFDPETGRIVTPLATPLIGPTPNYDLQGLAWRGKLLYVGDRRRGPRGYTVHIFEDRGGCQVVPTPRTIDLPERPVALRAAKGSP